jgi:hypothetical protein
VTWPVHGIPVAIVAAVTGIVCGILLYRLISRMVRRLTLRRRFLRGAQGERDAQTFLKRHGYVIIESQARRTLHMVVDGAPVAYEVRADFIARNRGKTFVVEVKTGTKAIDPASTDTRRQLLEYILAYDADGIRLFDAEGGVLHEVELPVVKGKESGRRGMLLAGLVAGAVVTGVLVWVVRMVAG